MFTFAICYRPSVCLSPVCLSVTLVRPTQAVEIFGNISTALGTLTCRPLQKRYCKVISLAPSTSLALSICMQWLCDSPALQTMGHCIPNPPSSVSETPFTQYNRLSNRFENWLYHVGWLVGWL